LAYKDEYEVARLLLKSREKAEAEFEGEFTMTYHLAPPLLSREGPDGRPKKRAFGAWLTKGLPLLAWMKRLRGTPFDPFGYTAERRMERGLIKQYESDLAEVLPLLSPATRAPITALLELPLSIRGFGPVKAQNAEKAAKKRKELLAIIHAGGEEMAQAAQ
jgi:indolepyruvate ferredoxin oxidoreductase